MLKVQILDVVKVSPSQTGSLFWSDRLTYPLLVPLTLFSPTSLLFFLLSTNQALFTECSYKWKGKRNRAVYWGVSWCLGQTGNWERCTVATISTWLSSSMNNKATLLALASACGAPLSLSPANTSLFSFFPPFLNSPLLLISSCWSVPVCLGQTLRLTPAALEDVFVI